MSAKPQMSLLQAHHVAELRESGAAGGSRSALGFLPQRLHFLDVGFLQASCRARPACARCSRSARGTWRWSCAAPAPDPPSRSGPGSPARTAGRPARLPAPPATPPRRASANSASSSCSFSMHLLGILPIEAHAGGARGDLLRLHQRGQRARHRVEQAGARAVPCLSFPRPSSRPRCRFTSPAVSADCSPKTCGCRRISFWLIASSASSMRNRSCLGGHLGVEDRLQQKVAQLFGQLVPVARGRWRRAPRRSLRACTA